MSDDKAELARIIRTANDAHLLGNDRWDEALADAIMAAGWLPPTEWQYAHQYWGWKTTDNMVKVSEAKFVEHAPTGHLANGEPYWNYTQHRRRKAGPWVEVTRQNDHGSIELSAPTQDGDTP